MCLLQLYVEWNILKIPERVLLFEDDMHGNPPQAAVLKARVEELRISVAEVTHLSLSPSLPFFLSLSFFSQRVVEITCPMVYIHFRNIL